MSTSHKSLDGRAGSAADYRCRAIAKKIDSCVFPGEQGGPHVNVFAALALTFKLAQTRQFKKLQEQTIKNAQAPGRSVPEARTASPVWWDEQPSGQRGYNDGQVT